MPTTLDTLAYAKRLREAGVPEAQADAQAEALNEFLGSDVASKADVQGVKAEIELARSELRQVKTELDGRITAMEGRITALDARITIVQWMMGLNFALTAAILGKLLFGH